MQLNNEPVTVSYDELVAYSMGFPVDIPTVHNRIEKLVESGASSGERIALQASNTRVVTHVRVVNLMLEFLELKREYGTPKEKELYKDMTLEAFVTRLLTNRPIIFINRSDMHMRRDGHGSSGGFDNIGTANESRELPLTEYITYDEMLISALLGVSCPVSFINSGSRDNCARPGKPGTFEPEGIIVGMVGARFERDCRMESLFCCVDRDCTPDNNWAPFGAEANYTTPRGRLMAMWAKFYNVPFFASFAEAKGDVSGNFLALRAGGYFNAEIYRRRMRLSIDTYLLEANDRAASAGKNAYVVVVGLGLGMWMKTKVVYKEKATHFFHPFSLPGAN